ncbi:MAG: hypothetical protein DMG37_24440 [Acidobacteria bacterium]|nr:MAG: hypothetical protein DMG37_24440 [Acidobacteriota bacterium]
MKAWKQFARGVIAILWCGMCSAALWAQEQSDDKPKPAARVLLPLPDLNGNQQDDEQGSQTMQPDRGPVGGVQAGTLGTSEIRHSYWVTGLQYGNSTQTNSVSTTATTGGWSTANYASGNLSLLEAWGHSLLGANYSGGGSFSSDSGSTQYHQLSSAWQLDGRRWQALIVEQLSYLPQSSFGFGGTTGLAVPGISGALAAPLPGLQQVFVPGQSVLSAIGPRYSSSSGAQLTYGVSRRGAFTAAVVYGLLRFSNSGNVSNDTEILNAAYNYAVSRKNSIGVIYRFTAYHFPGNPQALGDQLFEFMYARRVTGRLALGGGSGFFSGSRTDELSANLGWPLSRAWTGSLNLGYARNSTIVTLKALSSPTYTSWITGAGLNRPLGRSMRFSLGYQAVIQSSNGVICNTPACQTTQISHQIQTSIQWNAPPQVLR